jgi:hypothetical protein
MRTIPPQRNLEEMMAKRGFEVDHSSVGSGANRKLAVACTPDLVVNRLAEPYTWLLGKLTFSICTMYGRLPVLKQSESLALGRGCSHVSGLDSQRSLRLGRFSISSRNARRRPDLAIPPIPPNTLSVAMRDRVCLDNVKLVFYSRIR